MSHDLDEVPGASLHGGSERGIFATFGLELGDPLKAYTVILQAICEVSEGEPQSKAHCRDHGV